MHRLDVSHGDLVVAAHLDLRPKFPEILNQVVGKRIVVVENEDHGSVLLAVYTQVSPGLKSDLGCRINYRGHPDLPERAIPIPKGGIDGILPQTSFLNIKVASTSLALE
jgi:hypothetical protein